MKPYRICSEKDGNDNDTDCLAAADVVNFTHRKYPASMQSWVTIGPPAKRHWNDVSLAGRLSPIYVCILGKDCLTRPQIDSFLKIISDIGIIL